ncbi:MAG: serine/threonine protein kinase [Myxococcales bacterium]|nr:serine/threonine protein kinase [Myxococcales bacterium]
MPAERARPTIGRYEVIGDLACGGMAEILLGRLVGPSGFERLVVIKRIFKHLAKDPEFVAMFLDEARTVARINHPNVVQVYELGKDGDDLFLTMEYLEGESVSGLLRRLWANGRTLPPLLAAHLVAEACKGLQVAHDLVDEDGVSLDLVHRDVSPQNLFVTYDGAVKVLDFGIAKLANRDTKTEPGQIKGKFAYMSPEQCAGKNLDRRSDVFSLGIVFYEMLTGCRLFARDGDLATLRALCEDPIVPPSRLVETIPAPLDSACMTALSRRREERFASCSEMRRDLLAALRTSGLADDPEASLAALMKELYSDRIEEKREMIRLARLGADIPSPPPAEIDAGVELPRVADKTAATAAATVSELVSPATRPKSHAPWRAAALPIGVALSLGAMATLWYATRGQDSGLTAPASPTASVERGTTATVPATTASAPAPGEITLDVTASPPGTVTVDGTVYGETPVHLRLPRSDERRTLRVAKAGFETYEQPIVLDADQRHVVTLSPGRSGAPARPPPMGPARAPSTAAPPAPPPTARPEIL